MNACIRVRGEAKRATSATDGPMGIGISRVAWFRRAARSFDNAASGGHNRRSKSRIDGVPAPLKERIPVEGARIPKLPVVLNGNAHRAPRIEPAWRDRMRTGGGRAPPNEE